MKRDPVENKKKDGDFLWRVFSRAKRTRVCETKKAREEKSCRETGVFENSNFFNCEIFKEKNYD